MLQRGASRRLWAIAEQNTDLPIQTHSNEARQEMDATLGLSPSFTNEADLYEHYGLLTDRTILAHCTLMTDDAIEKISRADCGVAHWPHRKHHHRWGLHGSTYR